MMAIERIKFLLEEHFANIEGFFLKEVAKSSPLTFEVPPAFIVKVLSFLKTHPEIYLDRLATVSGLDNGPVANSMELVYHLESILNRFQVGFKITIARPENALDLASAPSVCSVFHSADWQEREAYDLLGIFFENHPDMRRILMTADWQGFPLRVGYTQPELYHGMKTEWEKRD